MDRKFIVAEISKNWNLGETETRLLLSNRFENAIAANFERGYKLIDWKISAILDNGVVNETIFAIFEKINNNKDLENLFSKIEEHVGDAYEVGHSHGMNPLRLQEGEKAKDVNKGWGDALRSIKKLISQFLYTTSK